MKPLSITDQLFFALEKRTQPMHVGGLFLFDYPEDAGPNFVSEFFEELKQYSKPTHPFDKRPVKKWGKYYWIKDDMFDFEHHVRHSALPKPGRIRELLSLISVKHSAVMDRERPMWEVHLIEGIEGRRFAMYIKMHHSLVDGVAAMRMATKMLSENPSAKKQPPIWAMPSSKRKRRNAPHKDTPISKLNDMFQAGTRQLTSMPGLLKEITHMGSKKNDHVSWFQAPSSILNRPITGSRRFAAQSYKIDRFKKVAKASNSTLNDVVVAVCGSALRNYLKSLNELPDKPLIAMVPVSVRRDESISGNQITALLANLGTHISDPKKRLKVVKKSIKESKDRYQNMTPEELVNFNLVAQAPTITNALTGLSDRLMAYNLIISNVPGPQKSMYWNGAQLKGMYPLAIPMDRAALNITLVSNKDQFEFGFTACRRTLPSMQRLLDYVDLGIDELEEALKV